MTEAILREYILIIFAFYISFAVFNIFPLSFKDYSGFSTLDKFIKIMLLLLLSE